MYLLRHYVMYWTLVVSLLLLFVQCGYAFSLPLVFRIYVVDPTTWVMRFRVVTVQIMTIPLVLCAFVELLLWPSTTNDQASMDSIYLLKVRKDEGRRPVEPAPSADQISEAPVSYSHLFTSNMTRELDHIDNAHVMLVDLRQRRTGESVEESPHRDNYASTSPSEGDAVREPPAVEYIRQAPNPN